MTTNFHRNVVKLANNNRKCRPIVGRINACEEKLQSLSDDQLRDLVTFLASLLGTFSDVSALGVEDT